MAICMAIMPPPVQLLDETWHGVIVGHGLGWLDVRVDGEETVHRYKLLDMDAYRGVLEQAEKLGCPVEGLCVRGTPEGETGLRVSRRRKDG